MGEADIIPIGTRGRPGRGNGGTKPSSSSRSLAGGGAKGGADGQEGQGRKPADGATSSRGTKPKASPAAKQTKARKSPTTSGASPAAREPGSRPPDQPVSDRPVSDHPVPDQAVSDQAVPDQAMPDRAMPDRAVPDQDGTAKRSPVHVDHATSKSGIPVVELVGAVVRAARSVFGADWEPRLAELLAFLRRRVTGDFTVDEYGFDREITERLVLEALRPLASKWFRIEVVGLENIPVDGGALIVSNHSGTVPVDGMMTMFSLHEGTGRFLRPLGADLVFKMPMVGALARKSGATLACNEDAERMLRGGELVGVWPEGFKGIGKPFSDRYKLQRFGRGGFVSAAIRTGVPIVPVSVVGAEEIYPLVGNLTPIARLLGLPYLPITPTFPLLGPLGLIPLPSKWIIEFGVPIRTDDYDSGAADDPMLVFNVTDQVRESIQQTLYSLLMRRKSVFG